MAKHDEEAAMFRVLIARTRELADKLVAELPAEHAEVFRDCFSAYEARIAELEDRVEYYYRDSFAEDL